MTKRVHITVTGRVQGVFFRAYTQKKAQALGITGLVMNQDDGSVFIDAQANHDTINQFIQWCHEGSPLSSVSKVEVIDIDEARPMHDFTIKR